MRFSPEFLNSGTRKLRKRFLPGGNNADDLLGTAAVGLVATLLTLPAHADRVCHKVCHAGFCKSEVSSGPRLYMREGDRLYRHEGGHVTIITNIADQV